MPEIRQLPPSVVNKIAAGEVIERPASVVKEFLENSVDAGATRIDVAIEKGGTDLIRVADNGSGIDARQLVLAVTSHATSKIRDADDLFQVGTLGFRGEALASIAEISHLVLRSRTPEAEAGAQIEVNGGVLSPVAPCGCPIGTTLEVRNLFFNTPVRRKFLRATQTEMGHAAEAFTRIALAHPDLHFTLRHGDRTLHDLPPAETWKQRIAAFFGTELAESLIPVHGEDEQVQLTGYVADPNFNRANNRLQYFFLNNRFIRDRSLQHALGEAYRGLLLTGRYPIAFLRFTMPPGLVDVNVHPTKMEVRFTDGSRLYSQVLGTIRRKFLSTDLTPTVRSAPPAWEQEPTSGAMDPSAAELHRRQTDDWIRGGAPAGPAGPSAPPRAAGSVATESPQSRLPLRYDLRIPEFQPFPDDGRGVAGRETSQSDEPGSVRPPLGSVSPTASAMPLSSRIEPPSRPLTDAPRAGFQIHNRYLVTENEHGMVVIDQHALHERILYEQLRERVLGGAMETQRLLIPEPVTLTPTEVAAALDAREALGQLGIEIEEFGGDTVLVTAYPAMLANLGPAEMLRQVVDQLLGGGKQPDRRELLDELLHMVSCKAAIKAGDRLTSEEISVLLAQRSLYQDTHHCPHGRPTALVFTREELDKRFKRT